MGNKKGWGYKDSEGNDYGYLNKNYLQGEEINFVVIDREGKRSREFKKKALIDKKEPNTIENNSKKEKGKRDKEQEEAGSTIDVLEKNRNKNGF
ncbi:hypothetical protein ECD95_04450, partial [Acinetobacter baumannii]|uniref:hypothetical protein n=1 Tax=Acinetobacter baumannii TaxID=470 RepID=UPI00227D3D73